MAQVGKWKRVVGTAACGSWGPRKNLGEAFVEQIKKLVDAPVQFCWER